MGGIWEPSGAGKGWEGEKGAGKGGREFQVGFFSVIYLSRDSRELEKGEKGVI